MEENRGWYFPDNRGGQDEGFENQGINQFKMSPYGKLAREIIQNSYDAKIKGDNKKVKVEFKLVKMDKNRIPNLESIKESINASAEYFPESERLEKFKQVANEKFESDTIDILKISDYNTTGLVGIDKRINSAWYGLIKSSGNSTKSGISGGSYGSGKHAAFVFSYFRTILYGTYVEDEGYAFQGKSILCSHKKDGVVKSNIGYWGNITEEECKPIRNQESMDEFYRRDKTGTDLYIIGAKLEEENWMANILYSVIENFWKLIIDDKLEVKIASPTEEINVDAKNIRGLAQVGKDISFKIDEHDNFNAYKFIELNDSIEEIRYGSICTEDDVELKIAKLPQYPEKKILKMRDTEMKINIFSPRKRPVNFIGILIATGEELNRQLRESEPQTHDSWNADNIEDEEDRKKVKDTIKRLDAWLNEQIDSLSYVDDIEEFDAEGLDFLNLEDDDSNGIEEMQRPFDEIVSKEEEEQEILLVQKSTNVPTGIDKTSEEEPKAGGEEEGNQNRTREGNQKKTGNGENTTGSGETYHEIKMKYVKTPYDSEKNVYRVIIRPEENLENSEIHFLRCTDSGELEKINVKKAFLDGIELDVSGNSVKNINLKENEDTKIEVEFETRRKCIMEVRVYVQN
ncbi:MAG: hypothetical protein IKT41_01735 [Clostridia bacterium]|nr:hypothetical protein [Clostridia bacterium]